MSIVLLTLLLFLIQKGDRLKVYDDGGSEAETLKNGGHRSFSRNTKIFGKGAFHGRHVLCEECLVG